MNAIAFLEHGLVKQTHQICITFQRLSVQDALPRDMGPDKVQGLLTAGSLPRWPSICAGNDRRRPHSHGENELTPVVEPTIAFHKCWDVAS